MAKLYDSFVVTKLIIPFHWMVQRDNETTLRGDRLRRAIVPTRIRVGTIGSHDQPKVVTYMYSYILTNKDMCYHITIRSITDTL
jgi:hypothetical protein